MLHFLRIRMWYSTRLLTHVHVQLTYIHIHICIHRWCCISCAYACDTARDCLHMYTYNVYTYTYTYIHMRIYIRFLRIRIMYCFHTKYLWIDMHIFRIQIHTYLHSHIQAAALPARKHVLHDKIVITYNTYIYTCAYMHTYMHMHICILTYVVQDKIGLTYHTYIHVYMCRHAYIHTYLHTYICVAG